MGPSTDGPHGRNGTSRVWLSDRPMAQGWREKHLNRDAASDLEREHQLRPGTDSRGTLSSRTAGRTVAHVIRTRQHLAALRVQKGDRLVLQLLRFAHELRSPDDLEVPGKNLKELGVTGREISMAKQLVEGMVTAWKPSQYHDEYRDDLMAKIESKAKAGEINVVSETRAPKAPRRRAQVIDLADLLRRSVEERRGAGRHRPTGTRGHHTRKPSHRRTT